MEPLSADDPRSFGPYRTIARLDAASAEVPVPVRHFIARHTHTGRTALVAAPLAVLAEDTAYRDRFRQEAERARQFGTGWPLALSAPVTDVSGPREPGTPWCAAPYLPVLPLPAVLVAYGGPLPERTVRALGAVLAEALVPLHKAGSAHAGLTPGTVFLAGDGPRLTGLGVVRAAASDGHPRTGLPGMSQECLPPEQAAGGRPRPLGDIFALGSVLTYAATGSTRATHGGMPEPLHAVVHACLAPDPADRPSAQALLDELTRGAPSSSSMSAAGASPERVPAGRAPTVLDAGVAHGPGSTVLDGGARRGTSLLGPGWLPGRVVAALSQQSSAVLAVETASAQAPCPEPAPAHAAPGRTTLGRGGAADPPQMPTTVDSGAPAVHREGRVARPESVAGPSRRAVLVRLVAGVAGVAAGSSTTWMATAGDGATPPTAAERLAATARSRSRSRTRGAPPTPRWRHDIEGGEPAGAPFLWREKVAIATCGTSVIGIDSRTGERLWTFDETKPIGSIRALGDDLILIPGHGLTALAPETGDISWQSKKSKDLRPGGPTPYAALLAADKDTVWCLAGEADGRQVVAYDIAGREEVWRSPLPDGYDQGRLLKDVLVVRGRACVALDRADGTRRWKRGYDGLDAARPIALDGDGTLVASVGATLRGYHLARGGAASWSVGSKGQDAHGRRTDFGVPVVHGHTTFVADGGHAVHAVTAATGDVRWQRAYGLPTVTHSGSRAPDTVVSPAGRIVLVADDAEVDALDAESGSLLWRFTDVAIAVGRSAGPVRREVALTDDTAVVTAGRSVYALPVN